MDNLHAFIENCFILKDSQHVLCFLWSNFYTLESLPPNWVVCLALKADFQFSVSVHIMRFYFFFFLCFYVSKIILINYSFIVIPQNSAQVCHGRACRTLTQRMTPTWPLAVSPVVPPSTLTSMMSTDTCCGTGMEVWSKAPHIRLERQKALQKGRSLPPLYLRPPYHVHFLVHHN